MSKKAMHKKSKMARSDDFESVFKSHSKDLMQLKDQPKDDLPKSELKKDAAKGLGIVQPRNEQTKKQAAEIELKTQKLKSLLGSQKNIPIKGKLDVNAVNAMKKLGYNPVFKNENAQNQDFLSLISLAKAIEQELLQMKPEEVSELEKSLAENSSLETFCKSQKAMEMKREEGKVEENQPTAPQYVSKGKKAQKWGEDVAENSMQNEVKLMGGFSKGEMQKDDKPHAPGTPEDSAHDVVEEGADLKQKLSMLPWKEEKAKFFEHLRSLKDKSQLRSEKNREAGMEDSEKEIKKGDLIDMKSRKIISSKPTKISDPVAEKVRNKDMDYILPFDSKEYHRLTFRNRRALKDASSKKEEPKTHKKIKRES
jgi:hypothetical protein